MSWMSSLWANGDVVKNLSENVSIILNGISSGTPIPITISQTTDPLQFWISTGVALATGIGGMIVLVSMGAGNPIKKAKNIKEFNRITNRPSIIIDHGKQSLFRPSMIDNKTVTDVIKAMNRFNGRDFNLILNTGGGNVFSSQLLSDALSCYPGKIHSYICKYSMSGGTLLSLSSSYIHMNEYSALGVLDVQTGSMLSSGPVEGWRKVVDMKGSKANDNSILHLHTGDQVTKSMRENIYKVIKGKTSKPDEFVNYVTSGKVEHIKQIKRNNMIEMGFNNIINMTSQESKLLCEIVD